MKLGLDLFALFNHNLPYMVTKMDQNLLKTEGTGFY